MRSRLTISSVVALAIAVNVQIARASEGDAIAAVTMEATGSSDVVRIAVKGDAQNLEYKKICGNGSIRIRLFDLTPSSENIVNLDLPGGSPLVRARLVKYQSSGTVVQLFPKLGHGPYCAGTSVLALGGELAIIVELTDADMRRRQALSETHQTISKTKQTSKPAKLAPEPANADDFEKLIVAKQKEMESAKNTAATASKTDDEAVEENVESPEESEKSDKAEVAGTPLMNKLSQKGTTPSDSSAGSTAEMNSAQVAAALGLAMVLIGGAWWVKRRKKPGITNSDSIEILSAKRLGARQQIVLASVDGTRFLLAVGDKSVSTLGVLDNNTQQHTPAPASAIHQQVPVAAKANNIDPKEMLKSLLSQHQQQAAANSISPPVQEPLPVVAQVETPKPPASTRQNSFQNEFHKAIGQAMNLSDNEPEANDSSSNVAGLIAMARMRVNMKRNGKNNDGVEA